MRRLASAIALAFVLSGVARAGEIHPTGATASPTPGTVTSTGKVETTGATASDGSGAVLTIILTLFGIVR